jgi:aldehyde dehydrogenase (NAD+)
MTKIINAANDTVYGLACNVFSENISRAGSSSVGGRVGIRAYKFDRGYENLTPMCFVKGECAHTVHFSVPFGGYKQSCIGHEHGQYALDT